MDMEFDKSQGEGNRSSPSQDLIFHHQRQQPMKREVESLEDFEDLTKDISSMKDVTAKFLNYETDDRNEPHRGESLDGFGGAFDPAQKTSEYFDWDGDSSQSLFSKNENDQKDVNSLMDSFRDEERKSSGTLHQNLDDLTKNLIDVKSDLPKPDKMVSNEPESDFLDQNKLDDLSKSDEIIKSLNESSKNFINFEQIDFDDTKEKNLLFNNVPDPVEPEEPISNFMKNDKLVDIDKNNTVLKGLDDMSFIPKKGESSPLLHSGDDDIRKPLSENKSNKRPESPTLTKFTSEPGLAREHEPQTVQGGGGHMNKGDEGDLSDGDDFVPEPIPKDYPEIGVMEGKQFLAAIGLDTWFHPGSLNPKIESLVYWRDPKKSGVVFASVLVILLSLTTFSLISVVAYTSLLVLAAALGFRIYKNVLGAVQKTSEGHPFKPYLLAVLNHKIVSAVFMSIKEYLDIDLTLNPDRAREISDVVVSYVNWAVSKSRSLFLVEDIVDSVKFGVLLWCLTYVGSWFNGLSLLIIAFVGLFTLPKVYENNKTQIDANLNVVRSKINEITEKIKAVSPVGKKTEESKDKSE